MLTAKRLIKQDTQDGMLLHTLQQFPAPVLQLLADHNLSISTAMTKQERDSVLDKEYNFNLNVLKKDPLDLLINSFVAVPTAITLTWTGEAFVFKPSPGVVAHEVCHLIDLALNGGVKPITGPDAPPTLWSYYAPQLNVIQKAYDQAKGYDAPFSEYLRRPPALADITAEMLRMYFNIPEPQSGQPNLLWPDGADGHTLFKQYCPIGYNLLDTMLRVRGLVTA